MKTKKVLVFASELSGYNIACFNYISEQYDLTLAFFEKDKSALPCSFNKIKLISRKIGPIVLIKGARKLAKKFDVVIFPPDLHYFSYWALAFLPRKYRIINWGIGFRVSYNHPYLVNRKHTLLDWVAKVVQDRCDASVFYMEQAKEFWKNTNYNQEKMFVAINSTDVATIRLEPGIKKELLFVGTLYKGKGLDKLLESYAELKSQIADLPHMIIVGDGPEKPGLEAFVAAHDLKESISFAGAIYDEQKLARYFEKALLCISPKQAGLSVLKSMGYGVSFVTMKDSITGGEIYNITNGENGVLYEKDDELIDILRDAAMYPQKYVNMGINAKEYYDNNATISHQAKGFIEAIEYTFINHSD